MDRSPVTISHLEPPSSLDPSTFLTYTQLTYGVRINVKAVYRGLILVTNERATMQYRANKLTPRDTNLICV